MEGIVGILGGEARTYKDSVRGISTLAVVIEEPVPGDDLTPEEQTSNRLFTADMRTLIENRLSEKSVGIIPVDQLHTEARVAVLYANAFIRKTPFLVSTQNGEPGYFAVLVLNVLQMVSLHEGSQKLLAPTWSAQGGVAGTKADFSSAMVEATNKLMDELLPLL